MGVIRKIINKYRRIPIGAKAAFWFLICNIMQKCVSLITTPIFTRMLTTTQYGQFTAYNSWLAIFTIFTTIKLDYAVYNKGMSKYKDDRVGYMSSMQGTTTLITFLVFIVYLLFRTQINAITELNTFIMCAMFLELLFRPAITFWMLKQRYEYKYMSVLIVTLILTIVNAFVGVVAVSVSVEKGVARILSAVAVQVLVGCVLYIYNFRVGKKFFSVEYAKFAVLFNLPLLPHYFSTYILDQADRIMIQKMCGLSAVGIYGVAYSVGLIMKMVSTSIGQALTPWEYQNLEKKNFKEIGNLFFPIMLVVGGALALFMAFAPEVMRILAGQKYYEAVYIVPLVTASVFFMLMYTIFSNIEFFYDANKMSFVFSSVAAIVNVILNYIFINLYGYIAAGYTTLACYSLLAIGHFMYSDYIVMKKCGCHIFEWAIVIGLSGAMIAITIIMSLLYAWIWIRYIFIAICLIVLVCNRSRVRFLLSSIKR